MPQEASRYLPQNLFSALLLGARGPQERHHIFGAQALGQADRGEVSRHFVMFDPATCSYYTEVEDDIIALFLERLRAFLDAAFHADALFPARLDSEERRNFLEALHL